MTKLRSDSPFDPRLIAHDLRHLMGLVRGHADLLEGQIADPDALHQGLGAIRRAADRAASVCEDLLLFGDRPEAKPQSVPLHEVLCSVRELCEPCAREVGVQLVHRGATDSNGSGFQVEGDVLAIERAVLNLTWNAIDAVRDTPGALVELRLAQPVVFESSDHSAARPRPTTVWIEVADNGPGLPEALIGDLTSHGPGPDGVWPSSDSGQLHGFGLVLSALVARRHNGSLLGRVRAHGNGAVLRLEFPLPKQ